MSSSTTTTTTTSSSLSPLNSSGDIDPSKTLNVNVGILGHVDSGKTSLSRALSTHASTAAFDKHPQSRERGITLDLGFSAFYDDQHLSDRIRERGFEKIQYTLVDCPGHASLIRTIIGGAQIIDVMVLVIDATKGIQTQTAECIVIGEITANDLIVVLNKVDMIPPDQREEKVSKLKRALRDKVFAATRFKDPKMIALSANPPENEPQLRSDGVSELVQEFSRYARLPEERSEMDPEDDQVCEPILWWPTSCKIDY